MFGGFMKYRLGIGGKLLLAFGGISMLTVASALVGWFAFERAGRVQNTVVNETVPFLNQALSLAETAHRIIALSPSLTEAETEPRRVLEATELFKQVRNLRVHLQNLKQTGPARSEITPLRQTTGRIVANLIRQNDLVKTRIGLQSKFSSQANAARDSVSQIVELSGALVSNAVTTTTATVANLYEMVEAPDKRQPIFKTLDRLIEVEVDTLERMFELRHRSAIIGLLIGQLERTVSPDEIGPLKSEYAKHLKIVERRVLGVSDPYRKQQAGNALRSLRINRGANNDMPIFALRNQILQSNVKIAALAQLNRSLLGQLRIHVERLVARSRNEMKSAVLGSDEALKTGNFILLFIAALSLAIATLIVWFYVRKQVANRIVALSGVTGELARGNLNVEVHDHGNDELSDMAGVLKVFKSNALAKQRLEEEQKETETELRRHKEHLEQIVSERTAQLKDANLLLGEEAAGHEKARERAEQANRAKTAFLAAMSHEIRTPISGILGTLHLLDEAGLTKAQKNRLGIIRASGETLLSIINDILDYSKIEAGHLDIAQTDFDVRRLIEDIVALMEINAKRKGLTLRARVSEDIPPVLKGDAGHVRQILINLVGNAIKFTEKGSISVRITRAQGNGRIPVRFEVEDTGIGISTSELPHLFDAFYQVQTLPERRSGGTGLGLSICNRLVKAIGGKIGVESTRGSGSTFWMQLPFEYGSVGELAESALARPPEVKLVKALSVLLVEDNPVNLEITHAFLERDGHHVKKVGNGEEALALVEKGSFDVVLMDISLPGIDGQEATRRIRVLGDSDKRNIPIIAMSAHVFREEISGYLSAGMNAFLGKPFSPEQLRSVLWQVIHGKPVKSIVVEGNAPAASGNTEALLDPSILEEDLKILGENRVLRMVDLFQSSIPDITEELREAIAASRWAKVGKVVHSLKSAAASLGLLRLHQKSRNVEIAVKEMREEDIQIMMEELLQLIMDSSQSLKELWQELSNDKKKDQ